MLKLIDIYKKWGDSAYIERGGKWMPLTKEYFPEYDWYGKPEVIKGTIGEEFVRDMFEGAPLCKAEIKTEQDDGGAKQWTKTGNIAIEFRYKGEPSGISTTKAHVWVHLLAQNSIIKGGFIFQVKDLRVKIKKLDKEGKLRRAKGGDNNWSSLFLLPISELRREFTD